MESVEKSGIRCQLTDKSKQNCSKQSKIIVRKERIAISDLTHKQEKFLLALITTPTTLQASEKAGITESTAYRYMKLPAFKEAQRKLMRELMATVTGRLQYEATASVNVLAELRDNPDTPPYSRVEASKILLEMAYKTYELDDVLQRIEQLEEKSK